MNTACITTGVTDRYAGKTYRHYKGGLYRYLHTARLESMPAEHMAVYQSLQDGTVWIRPAKEFHESCWKGCGVLVKRFEEVSV